MMRNYTFLGMTGVLVLASFGCSERVTTMGSIGDSTSKLAPETAAERISVGRETCIRTNAGKVVCLNRTAGAPTSTAPSGEQLFVAPLEVEAIGLAGGAHGPNWTGVTSQTCARLANGKVSCFSADEAFPTSGSLPTVPGVTDAIAVSTFANRACAVSEDGTVQCWEYGEPARPVTGITDAKGVAVGMVSQCVLHENGEVSCWGDGTLGSLGSGSTTSLADPTRVAGLTDVTQLVATFATVYALTASGELYTWGSAAEGPLACEPKDASGGSLGFHPCETAPVLVHGPSNTKRISAGWQHWDPTSSRRVCELDQAGQVACSGGGSYFYIEPAVVAADAIATSYDFTCAGRTNGEVGCWGRGRPANGNESDYGAFSAIDLSGL